LSLGVSAAFLAFFCESSPGKKIPGRAGEGDEYSTLLSLVRLTTLTALLSALTAFLSALAPRVLLLLTRLLLPAALLLATLAALLILLPRLLLATLARLIVLIHSLGIIPVIPMPVVDLLFERLSSQPPRTRPCPSPRFLRLRF
jgi:hypothetical protein